MRILRRIPVQYAYLDDIAKYAPNTPKPEDLKIKNTIDYNKPIGGIETYSANERKIFHLTHFYFGDRIITLLYPKKEVKLLLYDARCDNNAKNIPIIQSPNSDLLKYIDKDRNYALDELVKIFGTNFIGRDLFSLDYEKLQKMGFDGVHVCNKDSPLFDYWENGSTVWFNTRWINVDRSIILKNENQI